MNAVFIAGMSLDITKDKIKSHLGGITDDFIFTDFKKHPHREVMLACMEFASLKHADEVICFVRAHTSLLGGKKVIARYSDIQSNTESTRDILLVREELALCPPYNPRSIWPRSQSQHHHSNSTRYQSYRPYASLNPVKSHGRVKPPFSPTISSSSPPFKPVVCKIDTSDPATNNAFKIPESREIPGSLPRKPAVVGSSKKSDHNVSSDLGPSPCHDPPIPTGPKALIERISFTPRTSSSFPLEHFNYTTTVEAGTPETVVPIDKMRSDQISKALSALAAMTHKLKLNSDNPTPTAESTPADRDHGNHPEDNDRRFVEPVPPGRNTSARPQKGLSTSARRRHTREVGRRRSSSSSSFHHKGPSGRSSQRRSSYQTYEPDHSAQSRHRHRHGHHNHNRRYDHYRPESKSRPTTTIIKDEMKGFEHYFKVEEEEDSTIEPKYIGISEDRRRLIFGPKRREVGLALLADHKDEEGQGVQSAGEVPAEESQVEYSPSERVEASLLNDNENTSKVKEDVNEESSEEEVEEIEDERVRVKPVANAGVAVEQNENRESNEIGLEGPIGAQTVTECKSGEEEETNAEESKEEGEISEGLDHFDTANFHDTQLQTKVIEKCRLVGKTSRNASTTDTLSRSYSKSSSPNVDSSNTLTPKLRVYRISDLSSDVLDLMGIQLRYIFENDKLNRSDRWEEISLNSEGKGKVLKLAGRDLGKRLGMNNSEFEIEGLLRNGSSHSSGDEHDRPRKRPRSASGSADNEAEVERVGRKRKRIII
ncbi:hypothetical protein I204_06677 [Kwoniella mangroviensis CBS 8886]|uniref:uncharacterized protein n=1 Tax=Kwoniella mangroviensis CBS 8507 TaxID=1296122 RepID=UPI00080D6C2B|nr:uncharacterized protein I203_01351 [Kwoniella mangroviensis CBS 8507]OCF69494.1 hypothetical protein I203_01351 [Kwoniella mangroviensis CBS 8507]OCF72298.1 hypothetical protein I204_06677 [Kwoniella mangroviensis CBS 8886]